jgi:scyllo-inositol 2-dehydrogenase (NADP+)
VATVVSRDPARQQKARAQIPGVEVVENVERLWTGGRRPDLAVIATPTGSHGEVARAAISAGFAIVVDKPFTATAREAEEIAAEAKDKGTFLTVFHNRRWDGDYLTVRDLVRDGRLGQVFRFESRYERWRPSPRAGSWRDELPEEDGGGVLADLGSHVIDQALQLFGRPTTVYGEIDHRRPGSTGDDDAFVALEHPGGVRSHLWASQVASVPAHRMRVLGSAGGYGKYGMDVQEEALRDGGDVGDPAWGQEPEDRWGLLVTESGERRLPTVAGDWPAFYRGVATALLEGSAPPVQPSSAVEVLEVIEAAKESAKTRTVVNLPGKDHNY